MSPHVGENSVFLFDLHLPRRRQFSNRASEIANAEGSPLRRILYVIATLDPAGAEGQLVQLAVNLNRREFAPTVCCLTRGGPLEEELRLAGAPYCILHKSFKLDFSVVPKLVALIRRVKPDIVHTWLFTANSFGRAAAIIAGVPFIVSSERCVDEWKGPLQKLIDRALSLRTDKIIANAEAVKRFYVENEGLSPEKIAVIHNGIDISRFGPYPSGAADNGSCSRRVKRLRLREQLKIPAASLVVGSIGRLEPQKGFQYMLKAAKIVKHEHEDVVVVIVGHGEERTILRRLADQLGISSDVRFLGRRDPKEIPSILSIMDVFILPSLWEGFPNVILEAMASCKPVIATDVGGAAEIVKDGETGFLVPPKDIPALADRLSVLLSNAGLRERMGAAGRQIVERHYTLEEMVRKTEETYRALGG